MASTISKESLRTELLAIFSKRAQPNVTVSETSHITGDLGMDSLAVMEIVAEIEDKYDMSFPDDDLPAIRTIADVISALEKRLQEAGRLA